MCCLFGDFVEVEKNYEEIVVKFIGEILSFDVCVEEDCINWCMFVL